jgi:uncharacterized protein YjbJ (UPF0337 family)
MNQLIRNLQDVKVKLKNRWDKLTDEDIDKSQGNVTEIQSNLKRLYGYDEEHARREFDDFSRSEELKFDDFNPDSNTLGADVDSQKSPTVIDPASPLAPIMPRDQKDLQ